MSEEHQRVEGSITTAPLSQPAAFTSPAAAGLAHGWQAKHVAALLFFLAPVMSYLLPGRMGVAEFFDPLKLIIALLSVGTAAVLLREIAARRQLSAWGKLLLGIALGLFVEGLVTRALYAPLWHGFGTLAGYGRVLGVNWLWGALMLAFHATQSFLLPLLALELALPQLKDKPALGRKSVLWLSIGAGFAVLFAYPLWALGTVDPGSVLNLNLLASLAFGLLCGLLIALALRCKAPSKEQVGPASGDDLAVTLIPVYENGVLRLSRVSADRQRARKLGWLAGFSLPFVVFILPALCKDIFKQPAGLTILLCYALLGTAMIYAWRRRDKLDAQQRFALLFGTELSWVVFGLLAPWENGLLPDDAAGLPLVALASLGLLILLARKLRLAQDRHAVDNNSANAEDVSAPAPACPAPPRPASADC